MSEEKKNQKKELIWIGKGNHLYNSNGDRVDKNGNVIEPKKEAEVKTEE